MSDKKPRAVTPPGTRPTSTEFPSPAPADSASTTTEHADQRLGAEPIHTESQVLERLNHGELPGWYLEGGWLRRVYKTDGWPTTLMLVNAIGYVAEAAYHHPDLNVTWARVTVKLMTHSAGGITDKDFLVARHIEQAVLWRPAPGSALGTGTPHPFVRGGNPR